MGVIDFSISPQLLGMFAQSLQAGLFFETGTFKGESLVIAKQHIQRCISVEASQELYDECVARFKEDPDIKICFGDSPSAIEQHRDQFADTATVFWLDAHWMSNSQSAGAEAQSPLLGELAGIGQLNDRSAVLIDDARLYLATPPPPHNFSDWPSFDEVVKALQALSGDHRLMVINDVIVFYPASVHDQVADYAHLQAVNWRHIARDARKYQNIKRKLNFWRS